MTSPPTPTEPRLLLLGEAAKRTGIPSRSLRRAIKSGSLPALLINERYRVDEGDLLDFVAASMTRARSGETGKAAA